jgi:nucleoid-associated protein YgaU
MGLMDFFKKGKETPVQPKPSTPANTSRPAQQPAPATREYTIRGGDSLSKIAKLFYGNAADWQKIYQANKSTIKDPNLIYPGQKIIIP